MTLYVLQHVEFEGPGSIADWATARGQTLTAVHVYRGDALPVLAAGDLLVVMGGPMNIHEEEKYPWLREEKRFLRAAVDAGHRVLGICLGAQLLADVLGGRVYRNAYKEIGWFPVETTGEAKDCPLFGAFPSPATVLHWHGDTFSIPPGARHVARSPACENQAFVFDNRVVGLQFHLETTPESLEALIGASGDELRYVRTWVQNAQRLRQQPEHYPVINGLMADLLDRLLAR